MNSDQPRIPARVCICVDDFGLSQGVNEAVLGLVARGRIQATSCMVFAPAWRNGSPALQQLPPGNVDVGLHLDFTEFPSRPSVRRPLRSLIMRSMLGLLDTAEVHSEIRAQLDAFEQTMGRPPAYIDGHQHVHQLRGIREALIDEIKQRYAPPSMPWIRVSHGLPLQWVARLAGWRIAAKSSVITWLGAATLVRQLHAAGMRGNHRLLGIYGFSQDKDTYEHLLESWLSIAVDSDLLMCHPSAQGLREGDPIAAARLAEFAALNGEAFEAIISARAIKLMPMSQMLRHSH